MGVIQRDALSTTVISYIGLIIGYINKGVLFILFLEVEQIGLLNLIYSMGILLGQISNIGVVNVVSRFLPYFRNEEKGNYNFLEYMVKIIFFSTVGFVLLSIVFRGEIINFYQEKSKLFVEYYYFIIPIAVGNVFYIISEMYLRGLHKNTFSIFTYELFHRLVLTALLASYALEWISFYWLAVLTSFSYLIPAFMLLIYLIKIGEFKWRSNIHKIPKQFKRIMINYSLFSYFNSIGTMTVFTLDTMMIASYLGLKSTGIYTTIIYLIGAMQIPIKAIVRIGTSLVARYWKEKNMKEMQELYVKTSSISLIIGLFTFLIVWINIQEIFTFLPQEFQVGIITFLVFMIGKLVDAYFGLNGVIFITSKKFKYDIYFTVSLLVLVCLMNIYLIPNYGIVGAACSTSIALIFYNVGRLYFVWKWYKLQPFEMNQLYVIALFFAIIFGFQFLPTIEANIFVVIFLKSALITLAFFGTILGLGWNEDLDGYVKKIYRRIRP
jgi:O-antigen/teichoic acid export membrane protein